MANKQLDGLARIVKTLEQGLSGSISTLQKNIKALASGMSDGVPPKARKELISALARLRTALNSAILTLEKKLGSKPGKKRATGKRKK